MDGITWTRNARIAHAIDRSQDLNSGMVVLNTFDPEEFEELSTVLIGICSDQRSIDARVYEFWGHDEGSKDWSIQLCLCPHD